MKGIRVITLALATALAGCEGGCPMDENCLGECNIEGSPIFYYYPTFADVASAAAYCSFDWTAGAACC